MLSSFATFHFLNTFYRTIIYWQRYFYLFRSSFEKIEVRGEQDSFLPIFQDIQKLRQPLCHSRVYNIYFDSYIKPQQKMVLLLELCVVYLLIPTSNHNYSVYRSASSTLYIFWFLHQTTTCIILTLQIWRCISFDSYIKPQLLLNLNFSLSVVYLLIPTSNHNVEDGLTRQEKVVYLLIPTSNHNLWCFRFCWYSLYIFWFLHQTTTVSDTYTEFIGCISFDSYIKPQRCLVMVIFLSVVYLLIPTSNHNCVPIIYKKFLLYIFWFLHQTTT